LEAIVLVADWYWEALEDPTKQPQGEHLSEVQNDAPEGLKFSDVPETVDDEDLETL
jgi:hypothetical protein